MIDCGFLKIADFNVLKNYLFIIYCGIWTKNKIYVIILQFLIVTFPLSLEFLTSSLGHNFSRMITSKFSQDAPL